MLDTGIVKECRKIESMGKAYGKMVKILHPQPAIITDHAIPWIAHQREDKELVKLLGAYQTVDIRQSRMLPKPSGGLYIP